MVKKTYSKFLDDFRLKIFTNFEITVSIGHTSQTVFNECLSRCFSNFSRDSKIKSHLVQ